MSEPRPSEDDPDHEWLEARERGEDVSHVPAHVRAPYEKLGAMLASGMAPSPGFRRRVLDAIDAEEAEAEKVATDAAPAVVAAAGGAAGPAPALAPAPADQEPRLGGPAVTAVEIAQSAASLRSSVASDLEQARARKQQQRRRVVAGVIGAVAAAAAVAAFVLQRRAPESPLSELVAFSVTPEIKHGDRTVRGAPSANEAAVGDTLTVSAKASWPAELRVYSGSGKLIARCSEAEQSGCKLERAGERRRFSLELRLERQGKVQAMLCPSAGLPPSQQDLTEDKEAIASAGITCEETLAADVH